jgi:predicted GTPase
MSERVLIMGAAGRDFHNFNVYFRGNKHYQVIAFTATQIPDIYGRKYPAELAGKGYEDGIPIYDESELTTIIKRDKIDLVVFSYSDVSYEYIMHKASVASAAGANFMLLGSRLTMIKSKKPVISVCAVRTGCGKSQTTRRVIEVLRAKGKKVISIRHPMPYGDLVAQRVQRFATIDDLKKHNCTIEEMEEYEPHIAMDGVIYAGVDYADILAQAEAEADIIVWDGGNNDLPFYKPDLHIVVVDPHRPGHELKYFPGETNLRMADVAVINKIDTANWEDILTVQENIHTVNPHATIISAASPITVDKMGSIRGKKVLVIEDGPTLTHGGMKYGAGVIAAMKFGAEEMVDPRPYTVGSITETFVKYPEIGTLLPAMGYGKQQMRDLQETIERTKCDTVIIATPIDLRRLIHIRQDSVRVGYCLQEIGKPDMEDVLKDF